MHIGAHPTRDGMERPTCSVTSMPARVQARLRRWLQRLWLRLELQRGLEQQRGMNTFGTLLTGTCSGHTMCCSLTCSEMGSGADDDPAWAPRRPAERHGTWHRPPPTHRYTR